MQKYLTIGTDIRILQSKKFFEKYLNKNMKVMDIGAGNGYVSKYLSKKFGCKVYCSDIINYMEYDLPFYLIKNNRIPFKKHAFDIAIMNGVLQHMPFETQVIMIKEALRIAKKLLIVEIDRTYTALILDAIFARIQSLDMPMTYTHRKRRDWIDLFAKMGLSLEETKIKKYWHYPLRQLFFAVSASK